MQRRLVAAEHQMPQGAIFGCLLRRLTHQVVFHLDGAVLLF